MMQMGNVADVSLGFYVAIFIQHLRVGEAQAAENFPCLADRAGD